MRNYTYKGYEPKNFDEVINLMLSNNYAITVKDMPSFRGFLFKTESGYTLKVHLIGNDFNAYFTYETELGKRLTKKVKATIEKIMDDIIDDYIGKDYRLTYTETLGDIYDEPNTLVKKEWIGTYADFEAFKDNFELTAKMWSNTPFENGHSVRLMDDPNDSTKVIDNQKCLVTHYYLGDGKWNRIVKKIVCEKIA